MRFFLFALPFLLLACGSDADAPPAPPADGAPTETVSASGPGETADPALVGYWTQAYTQYSADGDPVVQGTNVAWTLRGDGTALEAKQDDRLGPDPLTTDYTWSREGDALSFAHAFGGAEGPQYEVVRLEGDTLTVHTAERRQYLTFARGEAN